MESTKQINNDKKLRATISFAQSRSSGKLFLQGAELPTETTRIFPNEYKYRILNLFFGEEENVYSNVSLGQFNIFGVVSAHDGESLQIEIKISININQELYITVVDPITMKYQGIGYVDLSKIVAPAIPSPSPHPQQISFDPISIAENFFTQTIRRRRDVFHHLTISLSEAIQGGQKHIEVPCFETCPTCTKSNTKSKTIPCPTCHGQSLVENKCPFTLNILPGIDAGTLMCFPNQVVFKQHEGHKDRQTGRVIGVGHLYITISVATPPFFDRIGNDISLSLPIKARFAKEGGQLQVPGIEKGEFFLLNLPPNTQDGATFQVHQNELYTLTVVVDTYRSYNLIALYRVSERLRAIKKALHSEHGN